MQATQTVYFEEVRYGKQVRTSSGPLQDGAVYGVNSATPGIRDPLSFTPATFLKNSNLNSSMIDPEFSARGAFVVKAVDEGLAFMRIRYRAEAGEGEGGRRFLLSRTLILPDVQFWHEIPRGLFAWCESKLAVSPFVVDQHHSPDRLKVDLPQPEKRDLRWFDGLKRARQIQLGSTFQAVTRRAGWTVSRVVAEDERAPATALIVSDLDLIAALPRKFPLRDEGRDQFIVNLGLDPAMTPGAINYYPSHGGSAIEAPDLGALRSAIESNSTEDSDEEPQEMLAYLSDNLDRRVGRDPIPLKPNR